MRNVAAVVAVLLCVACANRVSASSPLLETKDIRIRDPFIHADAKTKTYYLYAQSANRQGSDFTGVEVYRSKDLVHWEPPRPVLTLPPEAGIKYVWAPEMHAYQGKYYLFVTLTYHKTLPEKKPVEAGSWPAMHVRGTYVYRADNPAGPFKPLKQGSHTPEDWMALDGTLWVEDGAPYMVFCHEWVQMIDGTMDVVRLKDDLSGTIGKPALLFKASDAPGAYSDPRRGKVTDGCFLYRSPKSGKLLMIWSTFIPGSGYCVLATESESGKIGGPWINQKAIYTKNGGHGMLFRSFDGRLMLALHQPNSRGKERLHLFEVADDGETLTVEKEIQTAAGKTPADKTPADDGIVSMWECGRPDPKRPGAGYPVLDSAQHAIVFRATRETGAYNHHSQLVWHAGRFHAMWSNHPHGEDGPGQRVLYTSSVDGQKWPAAVELFPPPGEVKSSEEDGPVLTAFKWIVADGRWFAVVGLHVNEGFCDPDGKGHSQKRDATHSRRRRVGYSPIAREVLPDGKRGPVFALNENHPQHLGFEVLAHDHPTVAAAAGRLWELYRTPAWMPSWDFEKRLGFPKATDGHRLCEPTVYRAADGKYVMLMRDTRFSHRMFASVTEDPRQWPPARATDIPDSPSLTTSIALADGTILLFGNQMAPKFDNPEERAHYGRDPLTVSVSADGYRFTRAYALRTGKQKFRVPGVRGRGGGGQYPCGLVHDGRLYVLYSMGKEDMWVSSAALSELGVGAGQ